MRKAFLIYCIAALLIGCSIAPTKPNISAIYRVPALKAQFQPFPTKSQQLTQDPFPVEAQKLFQKLYTLDPALALEVGKLPEFQDKVDERQLRALTRFTELIANGTTEERANLTMLLKVGKPDIRRYCTPLQAIFWLLEKDKMNVNPLKLPLKKLIIQAWGTENFADQDRWRNYEVVTDRLNSPELINFYERRNFRYVSHGECPGVPKSIFRSKEGCCSDYTAFSEYCLRKAGYKAMAIKVVSPTGKPYHVVCEYEENDKKYIMDNSCGTCGSGKGITEKEIYTRKLPHIGFGYI